MYKTNPKYLSYFSVSALVGLAVWIAAMGVAFPSAGEIELIERLLLFAPLVTVPLAIGLVGEHSPSGWTSLFRVLMVSQPLGALAVFLSLLTGVGPVAGALAAFWLIVCARISLIGLNRLITRGLRSLEELCIDAGLIYLSIGGAWLVASRLGIRPMNFGDTIVLLTAVHFHYAGLAAPVIAGLAGRALKDPGRAAATAYRLGAAAVIAGPALVALGITLSPLVEVISATILALGLLLIAGVMVLSISPRMRSRVARVLIVISAASLVATMALAWEYALGEFLERPLIEIPLMAQTHGIVNVFGFSLCGLAGLLLEARAATMNSLPRPVTKS
jgi:hypothetical protein